MNRLPDEDRTATAAIIIRVLIGCERCGRRLVESLRDEVFVPRRGTSVVHRDGRFAGILCRDCAGELADSQR